MIYHLLIAYVGFEATRAKHIADVKSMLTDNDKQFLISFEKGELDWCLVEYGYFAEYLSIGKVETPQYCQTKKG